MFAVSSVLPNCWSSNLANMNMLYVIQYFAQFNFTTIVFSVQSVEGIAFQGRATLNGIVRKTIVS